jgi:hypothetical protein
MPSLTPALVVFLALVVYLLAGAFGLLIVTLASAARLQGPPRVLRDMNGFWHAFRIGMRATATWPWTWRRWTDG